MTEKVIHPIEPLYDENSEILILGSFPSVKSREQAFYYGHPQNRFWKVISAVYGREEPVGIEEKRRLILSCRLALWDVIASCAIEGSADSSIREVVPNDLSPIFNTAKIRTIAVNGKTAEKYYNKFLLPKTNMKAVVLPSTSPANASRTLDDLVRAWSAALAPIL